MLQKQGPTQTLSTLNFNGLGVHEPVPVCKSDIRTNIAVSVIIPAFNEEGVIAQCLSYLMRQDYPREHFEVIVVDNGSLDRTRDIACSFASLLNLTVLNKANGYISTLRNLGAASARGEFLAFLDADCFAPQQWLAQAVQKLQAGDGGVVGAFYTIPHGSSWVAKAWYEDLPKLRTGAVSYVPSGNLFISRRVFWRVGGFDPTLQTCEDFEFCQRVAVAGYGVSGYPELSSVHAGTPQTLSVFYRKQQWHGNGVRTLFLQNRLRGAVAKTIVQTVFTLVVLLAGTLALPAALATGKWMLLTIAPSFLMLSSFLLAVRGALMRRRYTLIPALTVMHLAYGIARALSLLGLDGKRTSIAQRSTSVPSSRVGDVRV